MTLAHIVERLRALATEMAVANRWLDHDACMLAVDELDDIRLGHYDYKADLDDLSSAPRASDE